MAENFFVKANAVLAEVVEKTLAGEYLMTSPDVCEYLVEKGFVEINDEITNEAGEVATRATEIGIAKVPKVEAKKVMSEEQSVNKIEIENIAVKKAPRGRSGKTSIFPFDALEVGQSFFVAATAEKPEPWKSMTSTCGTATRRYAEPVLNEDGSPKMRLVKKGPNTGSEVQETRNTRVFIPAKDEKDGIQGVRIGRIA